VKTYNCDRCNNAIDNGDLMIITIERQNPATLFKMGYDICVSCYQELYTFMKPIPLSDPISKTPKRWDKEK